MDPGECLDGMGTQQHSEPRVDDPARNQHLLPAGAGKEIGDRQGIRDHLPGLVHQVPCRMETCCAGVDGDNLAAFDECGAGLANRLLFLDLARIADVENEFVRAGQERARAAVRPPHFASLFHLGQIAPHGRNRFADLLGKFPERRELSLLKIGIDLRFALLGLHRVGRDWKILVDIATFYLT